MDPPLHLLRSLWITSLSCGVSAMVGTKMSKLQRRKIPVAGHGDFYTELGDDPLLVYKNAFSPSISQLNVLVPHSSEVLCRGEHESRWDGGSPGFP